MSPTSHLASVHSIMMLRTVPVSLRRDTGFQSCDKIIVICSNVHVEAVELPSLFQRRTDGWSSFACSNVDCGVNIGRREST